MARTLRMGENTFRRSCNFKELRVVKRKLVRYVPDGSLCTASAEQIFPRDSVQRNCFELVLYTTGDHDCISNRIGSGIRSAMQMSSRYVRCAPNAVDDRTRDHHADRSSVFGDMLLAPHRQVRRSHRSIHCWHGHAARRSELPRERFSPLTLLGHGVLSELSPLCAAKRTYHEAIQQGFYPEDSRPLTRPIGARKLALSM